jgi:hypothetical protein
MLPAPRQASVKDSINTASCSADSWVLHKPLEEDECKTKAWSNLGLLYTVKNNNDKMMNKGVKRTIGHMLTRIG